jgi:quinol monooxygenase YgiN
MPEIRSDFDGQTIITTFETTPGMAFDLIEALQAAFAEVISKQPGFLGAALHVNDARTRVCNYSQWASREAYQAMLRTPEMRERNRAINALCRGFEPVMYEVEGVY